jgi:gamma-glutamyltranspeptidase/glutathione hydrolase
MLVRRPGVARALEAVAADGRTGFYGGEFGAGLLEVGGGEFTPEDLERPVARWVPPLSAEAWGHRLWTSPPVSQGYLTLASGWIASALDLPADPDDPRWAHLLLEASRQAAWDRPDVLYDGADGEALLDPALLGSRRAAVDPGHAARLPPSPYGRGDTIALTAVDRDRMGVAVVQSNASGFGAHLVVPGVRIFLHNRGIGFSLAPGHPGEYRPGRRPAHTLSPLAVTRPDGRLALVAGTMGGDSQPQILLQILARVLAGGADPAGAVDAPRWVLSSQGGAEPATGFDTWDARGPVRVLVEAGGHGWTAGLESRGHTVTALGPGVGNFGHAHAIAVTGDVLAGGSDRRAVTGAAAGY